MRFVSSSVSLCVSRYSLLLLFSLAELGLLIQVGTATTVSNRLLALSLALLCPDLAHMAQVDLENVAAIKSRQPSQLSKNSSAIAQLEHTEIAAGQEIDWQGEDSRLNRFHQITTSTIVLELIGFHMAFFSLQWGAVVIILSQFWFNLLAKIQLFPEETPSVRSFRASDKQAVLALNTLALGLLLSWSVEALQIWLSMGLFALTALFLIVKYGAGILLSESSD